MYFVFFLYNLDANTPSVLSDYERETEDSHVHDHLKFNLGMVIVAVPGDVSKVECLQCREA